ncbi:MAG: sigma E protease regulator RseP [Neptuniibacter sp.]
MDLLYTIAITILTLGILVTIHEWGHFYVARRCGVKVLRFSVGFGKAIYSWKDKQGTEYAIASIPLGGYVKMLDEREGDVDPSEQAYAFNRKPVLQRIMIVAAGPIVNLLFAVLAYWCMYGLGVTTPIPVIGEVKPQSLAEMASIPENSEILSVDGYPTLSWDEVNLRLASRVGETGNLALQLKEEGTTLVRDYSLQLSDWRVDLENESPVSALGIVPWRPEVPAVIGRLVEGGRAEQSGLLVNDRVVAANGLSVSDWHHLVSIIRSSPEQNVVLEVERGSQVTSLNVNPEKRVSDQGEEYGFLGAAAAGVDWPEEYQRTLQYGLFDGIVKAADKTLQTISLTLDSIWKMIEGVISVKNLSGPITIAKVASASASSGLESYISFLAYLSIMLGVLNLLPIPVLDGGHLLYYFVELVTGKPVNERIQLVGLKIGLVLLLSLMFVALFNDIMRL